MSSKYVYILDTAHGINVPGKASPDGKHREYIWSRMFCSRLLEVLHDNDIQATVPFPGDLEPGLIERCQKYNSLPGNKIMISVHNNAAGSGQWMSARGFEIWTSNGNTKSDIIATIFGNHIKADHPLVPFRSDFTDKDLDKEAGFVVLRHTNFPAVLIENLFQDNRDDVALLSDKYFVECLVTTYYKAILEIEKTL